MHYRGLVSFLCLAFAFWGGAPASGEPYLSPLAIALRGKFLCVADATANRVLVVNPAKSRVVRVFPTGGAYEGLVPASTGVGGCDVGAAALVEELPAIRPKNELVRVVTAFSFLQCPALEYGNAFSRAIEAAFPDHLRPLVSGTASISPQGCTEHADSVEAQMMRTIDVVGALLESRGTTWDEVTSGLAYVKCLEDVPLVKRILERTRLDRLPILLVHADICRDDLLFELEVNAITPRVPYNHAPG